MAKNLSAIKRDQISLRRNLQNRYYKSTVKTLTQKALLELYRMDSTSCKQVITLFSLAYSTIDKAVKKGVISKSSGARKKSILANKLKNFKIS